MGEPADELLHLYRGLRVADVSDGMDGAGRRDVGLVAAAIRPIWLGARATGRAVTARYVATNEVVPTMTPDEEKDVHIEISVMSPLKTITDVNEIQVGKHGIIIQKGRNRGLLLPQVATEYGWDRTEFLQHTCTKAGLPTDAWKEGAIIQIFSAQVFGEKE